MGAVTWVLIEAALTTVVLPASREKPMAEIGWEEQGLAVALRTNGTPTVELLTGLVTVIVEAAVAKTGAVQAASARAMLARVFIERT